MGPLMGYVSTLMRIQSAFEQVGILFLDDDAGGGFDVRLKKKPQPAATRCACMGWGVAFWQNEPNPLNLSGNRVRLYEFDIQRNRAGH